MLPRDATDPTKAFSGILGSVNGENSLAESCIPRRHGLRAEVPESQVASGTLKRFRGCGGALLRGPQERPIGQPEPGQPQPASAYCFQIASMSPPEQSQPSARTDDLSGRTARGAGDLA